MKRLLILFLLLVCLACQSEEEKLTVSKQEQAINNYIASKMNANNAIVLVVNGSSYRLILAEGEGEAAAAGDSVYFSYVGYLFANGKGVAFDTNKDTLNFTPQVDNGRNIVGVGNYISGLDNGLVGMKPGEKAEIIFAASQGYQNAAVGTVPKLSALLFEVEMIRIKKQ